MKNLPPVHYRIFPRSPQAHLFEVTCTVTDPDPEGQRFALPAWIPGSYLIRDFARHVVSIRAQSGTQTAADRQARQAHLDRRRRPRDRCHVTTRGVRLRPVGARARIWTPAHGFFNGPSVFLRPLGREQRACEVDILRPTGARYRNWRVATAMRRARRAAYGFGSLSRPQTTMS